MSTTTHVYEGGAIQPVDVSPAEGAAPPFDYDDPELTTDQAGRLRDIEIAITTRWSTLREIYDMTLTEIGKYLLDAKATAPKVFMRWRKTCFPRLSDDICEAYMNAAQRLVDEQGNALPGVDHLQGQALRTAASPSTPEEARQQILEKATRIGGNPSPHYTEIVTHAPDYVKQMAAARSISEPAAAAVSRRLRSKDTPASVRGFCLRHQVREAVIVIELSRAYIEQGQGRTTRWSDVREDAALNFMNGDRVPIGDATESQWNQWMTERRAIHLERSTLSAYDWYADQQGELTLDEDGRVVFVFSAPAPDIVREASRHRKGKVKLALKVEKT